MWDVALTQQHAITRMPRWYRHGIAVRKGAPALRSLRQWVRMQLHACAAGSTKLCHAIAYHYHHCTVPKPKPEPKPKSTPTPVTMAMTVSMTVTIQHLLPHYDHVIVTVTGDRGRPNRADAPDSALRRTILWTRLGCCRDLPMD